MDDKPAYAFIKTEQENGAFHITLNRPQVRNAMNSAMVEELVEIVARLRDDVSVRAIIFRGEGGNFCSGGDLGDMTRSGQNQGDPIYRLNRRFGTLISMVNQLPKPVIVILEGAVLGGGFGLACVSDIALAHRDAIFGMPETSLGIPPAQIAPFVVSRIGLTQARRLGVLGIRFDGREAQRMGLVHTLFKDKKTCHEELQAVLKQLQKCAPDAIAATKKIMLGYGSVPLENLLDQAARAFSECIRGEEGREGLAAFKEKRPPGWAVGE